MTVIKRDGREVVFDASKISEAVKKAAKQVDKGLTSETVKLANDIACKIEIECLDMESPPNIEDIQNRVEEELMGSSRKDIARAYITYRNERTRKREQNSSLILLIGEKLMATNVQNQNANLDESSFGGRLGEARNVVAKEYALNHLLSPMARNHHVNNEIYEHDLDSYAVGLHNCLTVPVDKLLANGFSVKKVGSSRQKDVRPASNIMSAMQLIAVIFQAQSLCMFGGVSASHLDYTMVPYVRKTFARHFRTGMKYIKHDPDFEIPGKGMDVSITDPLYCAEPEVYQYALDLTMKDTDQAAESLFHNLNTLQSRSGNQLPFSSINFGTCTLPEGRMVIKALLNSSLAGLGSHHKTSVFPCSIFKCKKGINLDPGDPNYDLFKLALKSSSQRLYPNYGNVDWSGNAGYDPNDPCTEFATMGCRTFTSWDINGFGQRKDGRGNIAPVTIILPTVAMYTLDALKADGIDIEEASDDLIVDRFNSILDAYIEDAKEMLLERFRHIASQKADSAIFMYQNGCMEGFDGKDIISALKHGTLAIGQLGLAETLQILLKCDHTEERGMLAAKKIEQLFKDRCAEYKQQYRLNFGVYYTPERNRYRLRELAR